MAQPLLVERWGVIETTIQQAFPALTTIVPPVILALVAIGTVWSAYRLGRETSPEDTTVTTKPLASWRVTTDFTKTLRALANEHTNVKIIYFHPPHLPYVQRLAAAFELSGWAVNLNKTAQGPYNPHYYSGIEIKGDNRHLVETIAIQLEKSGCVGIKTQIGATNIKQDSPQYQHARHKVWITIGYEE